MTKSEISELLGDVKPPAILRGLSTPALETLAIIAYEQPVTKMKISEIRGVESESSIKTLESRGLIEKGGNSTFLVIQFCIQRQNCSYKN